MTPLEAFVAAARDVEATLRLVEPADWDAPGLGEWTVAELVAHLTRAAGLIATYLDVPVEDPEPLVDRVAYFDFDLASAAPGVAERSRSEAEQIGKGALVDAFAGAWRRTVARTAALPPDHPIHTFRGTMRLGEYAATRVLELVVHHMDLRRALGLDLTGDPGALALTVSILRGLLDGDPPEGLGGVAFVLAATGREPHDDPRLPVLS